MEQKFFTIYHIGPKAIKLYLAEPSGSTEDSTKAKRYLWTSDEEAGATTLEINEVFHEVMQRLGITTMYSDILGTDLEKIQTFWEIVSEKDNKKKGYTVEQFGFWLD